MEIILSDKKHILVVEDDTSLAEWIGDYLIDHDYSVTVASQGDFALQMISEESPDLVLLDVMLPVKGALMSVKRREPSIQARYYL